MRANMHLNQIPAHTPTDNHTHSLAHAYTITLLHTVTNVENAQFQLRKTHTLSQKNLHGPVHCEIMEQ